MIETPAPQFEGDRQFDRRSPVADRPDRPAGTGRPASDSRMARRAAPPAPTDSSNGDTTRPEPRTAPQSPGSPDDRSNPVTDHDRTVYGDLLDRAAERGLLSEHDYQIRLGELAEATTVDQMQRIVTELPAFTPTPAASAHPLSRRDQAGQGSASRHRQQRRRSKPLGAPGNRGDRGGGVAGMAVALCRPPGPQPTTRVWSRRRWRSALPMPFASEELLELGGDLIAAGHVHIECRWN